MKSFAAKLARFVNPAPGDVDPEDERQHSGSESESDNEEARAHYVEVGKSALRQDEPNIDKKKYSSASVSRRDIEESDSESDDESEDQEDGRSFVDMSAEEDGSGDSEEDESESAEDEEDEDEDEEDNPVVHTDSTQSAVSALLQQEQKEILSRLSKNTSQDAAKGKAVGAQMKIYEGLLDARISLQKAVVASHGDEIEDPENAMDAVCELIAEIQTLRNKLNGKNEVCKKRSFDELAETTFKMDKQLAKSRDSILSKWSRKVQLSSGGNAMQGSNFKSLNQSASRQIEIVLGDMDRLLKRTQVNRSQYKVNGEVPDHSDEIFDDTDFYRLLLTELVERRMAEKSANSDNLKWTVAKASKNGLKKARDTSASKGRRLRYDVQDKIVSFDAPRPAVYSWSDQQADDLFASLLGVTITMDDEEPEAAEEEIEVEEFNLFG